jgi:hypothetical protein
VDVVGLGGLVVVVTSAVVTGVGGCDVVDTDVVVGDPVVVVVRGRLVVVAGTVVVVAGTTVGPAAPPLLHEAAMASTGTNTDNGVIRRFTVGIVATGAGTRDGCGWHPCRAGVGARHSRPWLVCGSSPDRSVAGDGHH